MLIGQRNAPPPHEYWVPDFSDFTMPVHPDGRPYRRPEDHGRYIEWLLDHLESGHFPLNSLQIEILYEPRIVDWDPRRLGGYLGYACFSQFYWFQKPRFAYPNDFLSDPRPERVCDPTTTQWDGDLMDEDGEVVEGAIDLQTWLEFDCLFWRAKQQYDRRRSLLEPGAAVWSDIGWRPLLKVAVARAADRGLKRQVLEAFFEAFEVFDDATEGE